MSDIELIKSIRERTGLSLKDIKNAVAESNSKNEEEIIESLRKKGVLKQQAREGRATAAGSVFTYNHENRVGVLVTLECETDFVARSDDFIAFGNDLALHIAAYEPKFVKKEDAPEGYVEKEVEIMKEQLEKENKSADVIDKIIQGKKDKLLSQVSLLSQNFIKDDKITVGDRLIQIGQITGENVQIGNFRILKV